MDIYSREQIQFPLSNLTINVKVFEDALRNNTLGHFEKVYTGYASEQFYKENCHAFWFENYIIFYEYNKDIITKTWINYKLISETLSIYPSKLEHTLSCLGDTFNLILIDWNEIITVDLKNKYDIKNYIKNVL